MFLVPTTIPSNQLTINQANTPVVNFSDVGAGNVYICPGLNGILISSPANILIYSGTPSSTNKRTFIDVEIYNSKEHIKIYNDELVLEGENKDILGKEFINFLHDSFVVSKDSFVDMNYYFKYYPGYNKFAIALEQDKSPSSDWLILEKICRRYMNLKAFW